MALWYEDLDNLVTIGTGFIGPGGAIYVGEMINGIHTNTPHPYSYSGGQPVLAEFSVDANSSTGELDVYLGGEYLFTHTAQTNIRTGLSGVVGGNGGAYFDNIGVTSIPDASTMILLGSACMIGLAGTRRKRCMAL